MKYYVEIESNYVRNHFKWDNLKYPETPYLGDAILILDVGNCSKKELTGFTYDAENSKFTREITIFDEENNPIPGVEEIAYE